MEHGARGSVEQTDPELPRAVEETDGPSTSPWATRCCCIRRVIALEDSGLAEEAPPPLVGKNYTNATTASATTSRNATRASALLEMSFSIYMGFSVLSQV